MWANAVSVKIEWTDGEKVTWRRDSLANKPIEIIDPEDEQATAPASAVEAPAAATEPDQPAPAAEETTATGDADQLAGRGPDRSRAACDHRAIPAGVGGDAGTRGAGHDRTGHHRTAGSGRGADCIRADGPGVRSPGGADRIQHPRRDGGNGCQTETPTESASEPKEKKPSAWTPPHACWRRKAGPCRARK